MKLIYKKNNKRACTAKLERSGGFALLFSVLVSSLLLTIGLSIFSIALKELAISTATRQSVHAFYAADSGREYAKYRDTKLGDFPDIRTIVNDPSFDTSSEDSLYVVGESGPNFVVTVEKIKPNDGSCDSRSVICTHIISKGYDTNSGDKVERAIFQSY